MKNKRVILGLGVAAGLGIYSVSLVKFQQKRISELDLKDKALLSIVKDDIAGFKAYLAAGGSLAHTIELEGKKYKIGDLLVKYERTSFIKLAQDQKLAIITDQDWKLAVEKNNPEIFKTMREAHPAVKVAELRYGQEGWNLLHVAAASCSAKILNTLEEQGMSWSYKAKDGTTPLTVAVRNDCLQALSYWKEKGADFKAKDGQGQSALALLNLKKDAALSAFAESFAEKRAPASIITVAAAPEKVPNFYKKRVIPKDNLADRAHLIEPGERPDEANDTAEHSEFSD